MAADRAHDEDGAEQDVSSAPPPLHTQCAAPSHACVSGIDVCSWPNDPSSEGRLALALRVRTPYLTTQEPAFYNLTWRRLQGAPGDHSSRGARRQDHGRVAAGVLSHGNRCKNDAGDAGWTVVTASNPHAACAQLHLQPVHTPHCLQCFAVQVLPVDG